MTNDSGMTLERVIAVLERKSSVPAEGEGFDEISAAYDMAIGILRKQLRASEPDDCGPDELRQYSVRVVLDEMEIHARGQDEAEEIAMAIYESDARTHLNHGLCVVGFDTVCYGPSDEDGPTEP